MSAAHKNIFELIRIEHQTVKSSLTLAAGDLRQQVGQRKDPSSGRLLSHKEILEAAIATAEDAYALLMIAKAEGLMRGYLDSVGRALPNEPDLSYLISNCRKEFNKSKPKIPFHPRLEADVQALRAQRNDYAHGRQSQVFPSVARVASIFGRFFAGFP